MFSSKETDSQLNNFLQEIFPQDSSDAIESKRGRKGGKEEGRKGKGRGREGKRKGERKGESMPWGSITPSLLPKISVNLTAHHFTVRSSVLITLLKEDMEGRVLSEMMISQIVSLEHNQYSQCKQMGSSTLPWGDLQKESYCVGSSDLVQAASHKYVNAEVTM